VLPLRPWISQIPCYLIDLGSLSGFVTSLTMDLSVSLLPHLRWISRMLCYLFLSGSLSLPVTSSPVDLSPNMLPIRLWISHRSCYLLRYGSLYYYVTSSIVDLSVVKSCRGLVGERTWCVPHARSPTVGVAAVPRWRYDTPHPSSGTRTS